MGVYKNLHYFPLGIFFLFPFTFLLTYCIAVYWDHVAPVLPYISETGSFPPESCIFTQLLNIASLLLIICAYIRYRYISEFIKIYPELEIPVILNRVTAILGVSAGLGLDIAANFQESRGFTLHYMGAFICFSCGTLYFCIQTIITSNMVPNAATECMMYFRAVLSALAFFFSVGTIFPGVMSTSYFTGDDFKKWKPTDGGYEWHIISVTSEWLLSFVYCTYILTLLPEFRNIKIHAPVFELVEHKCQTIKDSNPPTEVVLI